ncbi:MAG: hypothetical protein PHW74_03585 [Desulfobacca sp.]|nr:hypothetical protein [Desulfobacca sp.]
MSENRPRTDLEWIDHFVSLGATRGFAEVFIRYVKDRRCPGERSDLDWLEEFEAAGTSPEMARAVIRSVYKIRGRQS